MSELERWEGRFSTGKYIFGEEPNGFLAACKKLLPTEGRALSVADGEGRNGVWLAQQGLDVVSLDFAPTAQKKVAALAEQRGVEIEIIQGDVHAWEYPADAFDVVVEIFTQFSSPEQRAQKWAGMRRTLKKGGLLILQGYTPAQLKFGTGGPKKIENLYTREMIETEFAGFTQQTLEEHELEMSEGSDHTGMSAVLNFTAQK
jgi:cyclopropane fatty-acyl-phospholipid synthase-like methyltransferase